MALVRHFETSTSIPNRIDLNWELPLLYGIADDEIIVTRSQSHFPVEIEDTVLHQCKTSAIDIRPIEIFRGKIIVGSNESAVSVVDQTLTDTTANFPVGPSLKGRLLRDSTSKVFRIASNTATSITVEGTDSPATGRYIVLAHFSDCTRSQQNFEFDIRTIVEPGKITDLVGIVNGAATIVNFEIDELVTFVFKDANDERFFIKTNDANSITFYQRDSFINTGLETFTYTSGTGVVQFAGSVDLSAVKIGHFFTDSAGVRYEILAVDDSSDNLTLATGLSLSTTAPTESSQGSVVIIPKVGIGMSILNNFRDSAPFPYIDTFKNEAEATARVGTGLLDDQFYYYTAFNLTEGANVAQAEFSNIESTTTTQSAAISTKDVQFGDVLYQTWPSVYRELDSTGDLEDLMEVFGFQFNEIHSLIKTYRLQDSHNVLYTALQPLSEQFGLPTVGFSIGADTLRRIAAELTSAWKLKGSKEGIALFIRIITTWDITNGTGDFSGSIEDFLPNVDALRFFDPNLGSLNVRLTQTDPFVAGGRFARSLPGVVIPGFFTFREFVIDIPDVAMYVRNSEGFTVADGTTTMIDSANNFGPDDSLVGNFLLPNSEEINDIFEIVGNTSTTITVRGVINNRNAGGEYAILSPLNANRFIILNDLMPLYIPFGTRAGFRFICN